jgi:predicted CxxxxCH...CXXCH cytochrome family protein
MWGFAPPPDLSDNLSTDAIGVGAHLEHVLPSALSDGYDCTECHVVPDDLASPGHQDDGLPAEVTFGTIARSGGANPVWDRSDPSCSGVYCHGSTLEEGASKSPEWNDFPPEDELCGTCHPVEDISEGSHEAHLDDFGFGCSYCHDGYGTENVVTSIHVDGTIDVSLSSLAGGSFDGESCSGVRCHGAGNTTPAWGEEGDFDTCTECHGDKDIESAPPTDLSGSNSVSSRGVGVHRSHVVEGELRVHLECTECHVTPGSVDDDGHVDSDLTAEVTFAELAEHDGATPEWDPEDQDGPSCNGVYCHGATMVGGSLTDRVWTELIPAEQKCSSCHSIPTHPDYGNCNICHPSVMSADTTISKSGRSLHINGQVDF